jgi:hypothetical protein
MSEIEELEGGYRRRRRLAPDTTLDVAPDQGSEQEEGAEAGSLTNVASDLHGTYGNQLVGAALRGGTSDPLEGVMAAHLGAAVGGLGAWAQEGADSNQAMCRAMRHASGGSEEDMVTPKNLGTGGSALPDQVRQRMQTAMGHDFAHVRVHTGGSAGQQAKDINALAFTAGSHIYFGSGEFQPGTAKGDRLIAHELTHVIQHDEHRLSLPDSDRDVSKPTDPNEVEAYANEKQVLSELQTVDAALAEGIGDVGMEPARTTAEIVDAVAEGAEAQATTSTGSGVHRAVENPTPPTDDDATDEWGQSHQPISIGDGYASEGVDKPQAEASSTSKAVNMEIKLLQTRTDPLKMAASGVSEEQLFEVLHSAEEGQDSAAECKGVGIPVVGQEGSGQDPNVEVKAAKDALYIGGGPKSEDVLQGGIGDCYFLSALLTILNQDPERIRSCIAEDGDNVKFTFWTTPDGGTTWTRTSITTDRTALQWTNSNHPGADYDELIGAGARVGPTPIDAEHFAEVADDILMVTRADVYEMALWAPLMEKAYARVAERSDQYGGYVSGSNVNPAGSGYEQIDGGYESWVYPLFYGPDFKSATDESTTFQAGGDAVQLNKGAIKTLLRMQGFRQGEGATVDTDEHVMVNASVSKAESIGRLVQTIDHCNGLDEMNKYSTLRKVMGQVKSLAATYTDSVNNSASDDRQTKILNRLAKGCDRQIQPGVWPHLEDPSANKIWHDLHEVLAIVGQLGADSSQGTRHVYASHAYAVLGVGFVDHQGKMIGLNVDNLDAELPNISGINSKVKLRNPHHTNEPNLPSSMVDSNTEDGVFRMTLDGYLRAFGSHEIGHVKDT